MTRKDCLFELTRSSTVHFHPEVDFFSHHRITVAQVSTINIKYTAYLCSFNVTT
uniref:Uncharacterized protein n=1 Tax=Anguilla anguilla TaxID=7936 RepID=A0A0E9WZS3_ANGAN